MQDTHWASGYYGYFPSYAWGNIYGGQLVKAMEKDIPDWKTKIANGKIQPAVVPRPIRRDGRSHGR